MNLQQLRYARALAETRSFGAAAEQCHVTQPSLSNAIAQLETELGRALFVRTTRSVGLSDFGEILLPNIHEVLNAQATLIARARQLVEPDRPLLRVGVSPVIGLGFVDVLTDPFRRAHPHVEVVFRETNLAEMIQMVEAGRLDFVFGPMEGDLPQGAGWQRIALHQEPLVFIAKGESVPNPADVVLADLGAQTFVLVPDACGLTRATRALFARHGVGLEEYPGQAMSYRVLQDWAEIGIGPAILPRSKARSGTGAAIRLGADIPGQLEIGYHVLWRNHPDFAPEAARLAAYLTDVAPQIAAGLAPVVA